MVYTKKEQERDELRGAVDGWNFKNCVIEGNGLRF